MNKNFSLIFLGVLLTHLVSISSAKSDSEFADKVFTSGNTGNLFIDEAVDFIKETFGEQTQITAAWIDKSSIPEKDIRFFSVRVYTNLCKSDFLMTYGIFGIDQGPRPRQVVPHMLQSIGAEGDCKKIFPKTVYPKTYGH